MTVHKISHTNKCLPSHQSNISVVRVRNLFFWELRLVFAVMIVLHRKHAMNSVRQLTFFITPITPEKSNNGEYQDKWHQLQGSQWEKLLALKNCKQRGISSKLSSTHPDGSAGIFVVRAKPDIWFSRHWWMGFFILLYWIVHQSKNSFMFGMCLPFKTRRTYAPINSNLFSFAVLSNYAIYRIVHVSEKFWGFVT